MTRQFEQYSAYTPMHTTTTASAMTSATEKHPCDMPIDFYAGECPDYGSMDCPKTVPGAKCGVDVQYVQELMQVKYRYYERRAAR